MDSGGTYLGFTRIAIMVRNTDLVEETVKLANDGADLLGKVTRVHGAKTPMSMKRTVRVWV